PSGGVNRKTVLGFIVQMLHIMWGSFVSCGRLGVPPGPGLGRPAAVTNRRAGCHPAPQLHLLVLFLLCAGLASAQRPALKQLHVPVPMRDGVHLSANVFLPSERARVPTILVRTPYGKGADITSNYQAFVDHGYAVMVQDVRGRYESEGSFQPLKQEPADGDDTLNWIARQPWSDGKVGMMGGSYLGIVQWKAAVLDNPHLKA